MNTFRTRTTSLMLALGAAFALAACDRPEQERRTDMGSDTTTSQSTTTESTTSGTTGGTTGSTTTPSATASANVERAGEASTDRSRDASITALVNAELAKDSELSALRINVDTIDGVVALRGNAPNPAARERATMLASAVQGVRSVSNELTVQTG